MVNKYVDDILDFYNNYWQIFRIVMFSLQIIFHCN